MFNSFVPLDVYPVYLLPRVQCCGAQGPMFFCVHRVRVFCIHRIRVLCVHRIRVFCIHRIRVFCIHRVRVFFVQGPCFLCPRVQFLFSYMCTPRIYCSESHVTVLRVPCFSVFRVRISRVQSMGFSVFRVCVFCVHSRILVPFGVSCVSLFRFPCFSCVRGPCLLCSESRVFSAQNLLFSVFKVHVFSVLSLDPVFSVFYYCRPVCRRLSSR